MRPEEFLEILRPGASPPVFKLGAIPAAYGAGRPTVTFDGESTTGTRTYPYLSSYAPAANDRVLLAVVGSGYVVLGKVT